MKPHKKRKLIETLEGYSFLSLNLTGFLIFTLFPVIYSLLLALGKTEGNPLTFKYFIQVAASPKFWSYFGNTLFFMLVIPVRIFLSLTLAVLLNEKLKAIKFFRSVYFFPSITSLIVIAMVWRWIYNPDIGLLNSFLKTIGMSNPPAWLMDPDYSKPALMIMMIWTGLGRSAIVYLAALQGIPQQLYEAANVDGANKIQQFYHITLPLLTPIHFFMLVMGVIRGFQIFGPVYMMTGGGPVGSTTTLVYEIFSAAFQRHLWEYASAISWVLFIFIFTITIINWKIGGKKTFMA